ncbi:MAG: hypothetical protein GY819_13185 [Planctomycetaceae bacterium]|nr:hypothetical protein [Planctomycetaceae bacterium]MCP4463742.1 hypothetical protein [Planctomycetaceae bacterium]
MFKKVFVAITLAACVTGLSLSGCGGPGEVTTKGSLKSQTDMGKDTSGNAKDLEQEAPQGTGMMD